jgi:hypothetical protein
VVQIYDYFSFLQNFATKYSLKQKVVALLFASIGGA